MTFQIKQVRHIPGKTSGAVGGTFWLNALADEIFGVDKLQPGPTFLYLFRRFGYPIYGWDGYKEVVQYHLTTPMRGVFFFISIKSSMVDFGYLLPEKLEQICSFESRQPYEDWHNRFDTWVKEKGYKFLSRWTDYTQAELDEIGDPWLRARGIDPQADLSKETIEEFWTEQEAFAKRYREEYAQIDPWPEFSHDSVYGETRLKLWANYRRAIKALLVPVRVRDTVIDIFGEVDPNPAHKWVEKSEMAGNGIGEVYEIFNDPEKRSRWWAALDKLEKIGGGDVLAGIESLLPPAGPET